MHPANDDLLTFARHWDEAMVRNDAVEIGTYMHEAWEIVGGDGITARTTFLERIASGVLVHHRMDNDLMHVHVYGDAGVVIARGTSAGTWKGRPFSLYEWSTSVFVRRGSAWRCLTTMLTPVVP